MSSPLWDRNSIGSTLPPRRETQEPSLLLSICIEPARIQVHLDRSGSVRHKAVTSRPVASRHVASPRRGSLFRVQPVLGRRGTYKEGGAEAGALAACPLWPLQHALSGLQGPGQVQSKMCHLVVLLITNRFLPLYCSLSERYLTSAKSRQELRGSLF